jgi:hypothetical protein
MFEISDQTANKTQLVTMTTINWLMLCREIIADYCENHTKPINTLCGQNAELLNVIASSTYSYHRALKC